MTARDKTLARTFIELADTLVTDFDLVDFLSMLTERCVELLDVSEVGVVLADKAGRLNVMASSSERMRILELFELQNDEGPCKDAFAGVRQVLNESLVESDRWPSFSRVALEHGFTMAHAFPMRLRDECLGAMNVFQTEPHDLSESDATLAQALADAATIGILQERIVRHNTELAGQLQQALSSRIVIEQAKGVLAERLKVGTDEAFSMLRQYSRNHNERVVDVANRIASGELHTLQ